MKTRTLLQSALVAAWGFALLAAPGRLSAQSNSPPVASADTNAAEVARQALQANLALQEQVRNLQRSLDDYRQQAETNAKRSEEVLSARFKSIEQSLSGQQQTLAAQQQALSDQRQALADQRQREIENSRIIMYVSGSFAVAALAAILGTAWLQLRTIQRLTEVGTGLRLAAGGGTPFTLGEAMAPGEGVVAQTTQRYLEEMQRLRRRVNELEHAGATEDSRTGNGGATTETPAAPMSSFPTIRPASAQPVNSLASEVAVLLGKGQTFLNLDQNERALACFEEALAIEPDHVEGLIKRGAALERLQRFDDAIAVYDRVIGLDERQTTAYLLKGGVYNRLKRFNDALACYDQALKTQSQRKS